MTAAAGLRSILLTVGLMAGFVSLSVLTTELAATVIEPTSRSSEVSQALVAPLALINSSYARQQTLAAVPDPRLPAGSRPSRAEIEQTKAMISTLSALSPTNPELWIIQARLAASLRADDQRIAEMLKMAYLTAPSNFALMPSRLEIAMTTSAVSDPVLEVLAEGDIRAILLKRIELSDDLLAIYQRATEPGKAFLMRAAASDTPLSARLTAANR